MRLKARGKGLLLLMDSFLLKQKLFLLGDQTADLFAQLGEGFLEPVDHGPGAGFFLFIVAGQALQQGFGLMIRMFGTATHRAGLVILQLPAQFFDAGATGQALAFQQLAGDLQGLLGHFKVGLGLYALLAQAVAFLLHAVLLELQLLQAAIEHLLAAAQALQVFEGALLQAVVLKQAAQGVDLFVDRMGLGPGFLEQDFKAVAQLAQLLRGLLGSLLKAG